MRYRWEWQELELITWGKNTEKERTDDKKNQHTDPLGVAGCTGKRVKLHVFLCRRLWFGLRLA